MAVKRVILQQFSMQLSYMNANKTERANIFHPSLRDRELSSSVSTDFSIPNLPKRVHPRQQTESSGSDEDHYEFKRDSDSHPATPSDHFSDEDLQTILDNVSISSSSTDDSGNGKTSNKHPSKAINCSLIDKSYDDACCKDVTTADCSPLQSRRGRRQLYIVCPSPSG